MAMPFLLIAAAVLAGSGQTSADPKAKDGIAAFFDLCESTVTGLETPVEANRFRFTKLSSEFVARIRPMSKDQPFWDMQGIESGVRALAHIEANGVCALEIVEASEPQTRGRFDDQLQSVAERLGGVVQKQPDAVENRARRLSGCS